MEIKKTDEYNEANPEQRKSSELAGDVLAKKAGFSTLTDSLCATLSREVGDEHFEVVKMEERLTQLKSDIKNIDAIPENEREEFVLKMRREIITAKFLVKYIYENKADLLDILDLGDSVEIFWGGKDGSKKIDLAKYADDISLIEKGLGGVKVKLTDSEGKETESALYDDLEKKRESISPKEFLNWRYKGNWKEMLKLVSNIASWDELQQEKLVVFDFGGNSALEYQVGLGDLMPPRVRKISLNGLVYERRGTQGFYNCGKYLAIFSGTQIKIEESVENYEEKNKEEYSNKFGDKYVESDEKIEDAELAPTRSQLLDISRDFGVDAYLLEALYSYVKDDIQRGITDPFEFLHIAARYLQNAEVNYEISEKKPYLKGQTYTAEFVVYALDRFSLFTSFMGKNQHAYDVLEKYSEIKGVKILFDKDVLEKSRDAAVAADVKYYGGAALPLGAPLQQVEFNPESYPADYLQRVQRLGVPAAVPQGQRYIKMLKYRKGLNYFDGVMGRPARGWITRVNVFEKRLKTNIVMGCLLKELEFRCKKMGMDDLNFHYLTSVASKKGYHGIGMAIDFDPSDNWLAKPNKTKWNLPMAMVIELQKMGFRWGR